jgi:hypothetical protein
MAMINNSVLIYNLNALPQNCTSVQANACLDFCKQFKTSLLVMVVLAIGLTMAAYYLHYRGRKSWYWVDGLLFASMIVLAIIAGLIFAANR